MERHEPAERQIKALYQTINFLGKKKYIYAIGIIGLSLGYNSMQVIMAFLLKYMVDLSENKTAVKHYIIFSIIGLICLIAITGTFQAMYAISGRYAIKNIRHMINEKRKKLPYKYFDHDRSGELFSKITYDIEKISENLTAEFRNVVSPIISFLFSLLPMLVLHIKLTVILLMITFSCLLINILFVKPYSKSGKKLSLVMKSVSKKLIDAFGGLHTIKINGAEEGFCADFEQVNILYQKIWKKKNKLYAELEAFDVLFTLWSSLVFLAVGSYFVVLGEVAYGTLLSLIYLQSGLTYGCLTASKKISVVFENLIGTHQIYDFLNLPEEELRKWSPPKHGMIELSQYILVISRKILF